MKAVAFYAGVGELARDREKARHRWEVAMKGRIEACDLHDIGKAFLAGLDHVDFCRQMLRGIVGELAQRIHHLVVDALRSSVVRPAMDDAMADSIQARKLIPLIKPVQQVRDSAFMIGTSYFS